MSEIRAEEIDRVVREVMARLSNSAPPANISAAAAEDLVLTARVVSLEEIKRQVKGIRRLVVAQRAIVTPAVADLLKEHEIELVRQTQEKTSPRVSVTLIVGMAETAFEPSAVNEAMTKSGVRVERLAKSGLTSVVREMADGVGRGGSLGLLLTGRTAAAVCLANRTRGVRAVTGMDAASVKHAVGDAAANLLALDPTAIGPWAVRRMVAIFCEAKRACPEELA